MPTERRGTQRRSSTTPGSISSSRSRGAAPRASGERGRRASSSSSRGSPRAPAPRAPARRRRARPPIRARRRSPRLDVVDDAHEIIRSTGTSRIDDAPAASSFGSSRQTSAAGTSACTATIPGSASWSTLGAREPGTSSKISSSARLRRVQHQVAVAPRLDDRAEDRGQPARVVALVARDQHGLGFEERPERAQAVRAQRAPARDEVDDRVCEAQARRDLDRAGDVDELGGDAALCKQLARESWVGRRDVRAAKAARARGSRDSSGTAASSRQPPKPSFSSSVTLAPRSRTRSAPVIPQSTTPSCTYSGTSAARTSSTSTGALRHGNASARSPGSSGPRPGVVEQRDRRLAQAALRGDGDRQAVGRRRFSRLSTSRYPPSP